MNDRVSLHRNIMSCGIMPKGLIPMARKASRKVAVVYCQGGDRAKWKIERAGAEGDCVRIAAAYPEGALECSRGCLGAGTCVAACRLDAIHINSHGVAEVDNDKCVGCGSCAKACPQEVIGIIFRESSIMPRCSNPDKGGAAKGMCDVSCVACRICEKNCPADAITVLDNCATIDESRCIACGMCAIKCPRGVIVDSNGIFTRK